MLNPVLKGSVAAIGLTACVVVCSACGSNSPSMRETVRQVADDQAYRGFIAEGSLGHRLELVTQPGGFGRASAVLTRGDDVWQVSDSNCPAFKNQIERFRSLPSLKPGPYLLQPDVGPGTPMAGRWNGEAWTIRTQLFAPDWSSVDVEMQGGQGPYARWLSEAVAAIKSCGPPSKPVT